MDVEPKKSEDEIMTTFVENESERCSSTSTTRREANAEPSEKDVAETDQFVSGAAGTGQMNRAWKFVSGRLGAVNIGELDTTFCTTTRWLRHLQRQVTRLDMRKKAVLSKRPVIRTEVW
jgi:hypothetical protein